MHGPHHARHDPVVYGDDEHVGGVGKEGLGVLGKDRTVEGVVGHVVEDGSVARAEEPNLSVSHGAGSRIMEPAAPE
jgi:hypothetical protein